MDRGWYKTWRKDKTSAIWEMPGMYYRAWHWMLSEATHLGNANRRGLPPGTFTATQRQMREALAWRERSVERRHSFTTLNSMLKWFKENKMIDYRDSGDYTTIDVLNWDVYQDDRYSQSSGRSSGQSSTFKNGTRIGETPRTGENAAVEEVRGEIRLLDVERRRP